MCLELWQSFHIAPELCFISFFYLCRLFSFSGFWCSEGSKSAQQFECGSPSVYCPFNSLAPLTVASGNYSAGGLDESTRTEQRICEPGSACQYGRKTLWFACVSARAFCFVFASASMGEGCGARCVLRPLHLVSYVLCCWLVLLAPTLQRAA
jgi:hypothetical protein